MDKDDIKLLATVFGQTLKEYIEAQLVVLRDRIERLELSLEVERRAAEASKRKSRSG